jgi:type II pantothenate kinase
MVAHPAMQVVALVGVAATIVWVVRRRRELEARDAARAAPASQRDESSRDTASAAATALHAADGAALSRTPSRAWLDATTARFGFDIGGSLTKFIYLEQDDEQDDAVLARARRARERAGLEPALSVAVPALGGRLHFAHFQTVEVEKTVKMLKRHRLADGVRIIHATGGGAHKYRRLIESTLHTTLSPCNELEAVVHGICLMAKSVSDECYTLEAVADPSEPVGGEGQPQSVIIPPEQLGIEQMQAISKPFSGGTRDDFFPFLLCNVGTGVSILHVESERQYTRVSGTAVGGGTFMGLTRLLTRARKFQEALDTAAAGDARRVDMLVNDIYGNREERSGLNLPGDLTASFFAKNITAPDGDPRAHVQDDDICKALVVMIAQNLAQIAHLNARIHGARRVFFTGNFLRNNGLALRTIVYTMRRWSDLDMQRGVLPTEAIFFRHEGYFGAIGAFLQTLDSNFVSDLDFSAPPTPPAAPSAAPSGQPSPKPQRTERRPGGGGTPAASAPGPAAPTESRAHAGSRAAGRARGRGGPVVRASPKGSPLGLRRSAGTAASSSSRGEGNSPGGKRSRG